LELVGAAVMIVVAVVLIVAVVWPPPLEQALRIVALGPRASGKTLLLSSTFVSLSRYAPADHPYLLEAVEAQDANRLFAVNAQLRSGTKWPKSTVVGDRRTFEFDSVCNCERGKLERLFRIGYLDYGGETLHSDDIDLGDSVEDLDAHVKQANALLGIVDGEKVVALLEGDEGAKRAARDYFASRFAMIDYYLRVARSPFQLVVTKWDIVDAEEVGDARLTRVRAALDGERRLHHVVAGATANEIVRIIPVSSVGWGYAALNDDGEVERQGGEPSPWNVEVPLAALVVDRLTRIERSLPGKVLDRLKWLIDRRDWRAARSVAAKATLPAAFGVIVPVAGPILGVVVMDYLSRRYELAFAEENVLDLSDADRCRRAVIDHYHKTVIEFDKEFPSSILRNG